MSGAHSSRRRRRLWPWALLVLAAGAVPAGQAMLGVRAQSDQAEAGPQACVTTTRVRLVGRSERAVHALAYLVDEERKRVSYVMEEIFLCIDMETRRTTPWDDDVAAQIDARVKEHQDLPWQAELSGSMALR